MTNVYGYLVATVGADGSISTSFQQLKLEDLIEGEPASRPSRWCAGATRRIISREPD